MRSLWLFLLSASLWGQTLTLSRFQDGSTSLAGSWKFHAGDDPRWADPNFDDSDWKLVQVPLSLNQQGYPNFSGYGWYRITLQRPAQDLPSDSSLAVVAITNVAEFYANGVSFGRFGAFPPHPRVYETRPLSFRIPLECWHRNRLLLAIRIWVDKRFGFWKQSGLSDASDTGSPAPAIGTPATIGNLIAAHQRIRELRQLPGELVKFAELLLSLYLLGLYWTESRRPEYLWLGINFIGSVILVTSPWISGSTFLWTAGNNLLLNCLLNPVMFTTAFLGIWATCEERIGLLPKIQSPSAVLSWLNEQLLHRIHEGFVTCLCVRLSADGSLTVANAGHLAPYVNGQELATVNGLPLGISSEVEYSETQHVLAPEDTLTSISDGVVEARDKARNLFGFERLQQALLEQREADAIARSAQQFGQEDDITVISISRQVGRVKPLSRAQAASTSIPSPISG